MISNQVSEAKDIIKNSKNMLWHQEPAANWNDALPLGNGKLGAMVSGGITQKHNGYSF